MGKCSHDHGHDHDHSHGHGPAHAHGVSSNLALAFALNLGFAIIEFFGGLLTNSVAVMSDALHDFGDAMAIGLAWFLEKKSQQRSDRDFSYGYRRYSTASALATGLILVAGSIFILSEAVPRLWSPEATNAEGMILLAILGLSVNGFAAWRVSRGTSMNEKMIMFHLIEDVAGWAIVLIGAVCMKLFSWVWVDPVLACALAVWILWNAGKNLRAVFRVLLQGVPQGLDIKVLEENIRAVPGVCDIHHVHLWSLDGSRHVFTAHLVVQDIPLRETDRVKNEVKRVLAKQGITEATLEIETIGADCADPHHH